MTRRFPLDEAYMRPGMPGRCETCGVSVVLAEHCRYWLDADSGMPHECEAS